MGVLARVIFLQDTLTVISKVVVLSHKPSPWWVFLFKNSAIPADVHVEVTINVARALWWMRTTWKWCQQSILSQHITDYVVQICPFSLRVTLMVMVIVSLYWESEITIVVKCVTQGALLTFIWPKNVKTLSFVLEIWNSIINHFKSHLYT